MQTEKRFQCRHIFTDGHRCGSPTLLLETPELSQPEQTHEDFCYYHHTTRRPHPRARAASDNPAQTAFDLPLPEDRSSVQAAIGEVLRNIAANTLDPRRAGLLLYGLQIAALNLPPHPRPHPLHERDEIPEPVTAIVTHPTHGPIAPTAELAPPPVYKSHGQMLMEEFGPPPPEPTPASAPVSNPHSVWGETWGNLSNPYAAVQQQKQQAQQEAGQHEGEPSLTILPNLEAVASGDEAPQQPARTSRRHSIRTRVHPDTKACPPPATSSRAQKTRHLDRSEGRPHRPSRSGETPVFALRSRPKNTIPSAPNAHPDTTPTPAW